MDAVPADEVVTVASWGVADSEDQFATEGLDEESEDFTAFGRVWEVGSAAIALEVNPVRCSDTSIDPVSNRPRFTLKARALEVAEFPRHLPRRTITHPQPIQDVTRRAPQKVRTSLRLQHAFHTRAVEAVISTPAHENYLVDFFCALELLLRVRLDFSWAFGH